MNSIDIVVGGQFGSEGKGKIVHYLACKSHHKCAMRVGGSNSGHSVDNIILRHLPVTATIPGAKCLIGAGSYIDPEVLIKEIDTHNPTLAIDEKAFIQRKVSSLQLKESIGSTQSGTGSRIINRIKRKVIPHNESKLLKYLYSSERVRRQAELGCIIEGTQGIGLSLIHSPYYPYVTSRDTSAGGFISEAGISPLKVHDIILVIRAFPIRVAGNSGPLPKETSWKKLGLKEEYTSVTKNVRRVAKFDLSIVRLAVEINRPTIIVLNHVDYIESSYRRKFVQKVQMGLGREIDYVGLGSDITIENPWRI